MRGGERRAVSRVCGGGEPEFFIKCDWGRGATRGQQGARRGVKGRRGGGRSKWAVFVVLFCTGGGFWALEIGVKNHPILLTMRNGRIGR